MQRFVFISTVWILLNSTNKRKMLQNPESAEITFAHTARCDSRFSKIMPVFPIWAADHLSKKTKQNKWPQGRARACAWPINTIKREKEMRSLSIGWIKSWCKSLFRLAQHIKQPWRAAFSLSSSVPFLLYQCVYHFISFKWEFRNPQIQALRL